MPYIKDVMTMTFSLHESIAPNGAIDSVDPTTRESGFESYQARDSFHLLREKLAAPSAAALVARPRITSLLDRSVAQYPATLICGRAGTGKSRIAASYAAGHPNVSWFTVESTDVDWCVFSRYFAAALSEKASTEVQSACVSSAQGDIAKFLLDCFSSSYLNNSEQALIVLDDIHHVFDAPWFDDFFQLLLYSLPLRTHLLLLCRSKPPSPLWRLRSKQMLNVLEERVIAFDLAEPKLLLKLMNRPVNEAEEAQRVSYGRISKLLEWARPESVVA
jgi:LuxR family transcriptional regulator, maltose regulon positive regulatory protein